MPCSCDSKRNLSGLVAKNKKAYKKKKGISKIYFLFCSRLFQWPFKRKPFQETSLWREILVRTAEKTTFQKPGSAPVIVRHLVNIQDVWEKTQRNQEAPRDSQASPAKRWKSHQLHFVLAPFGFTELTRYKKQGITVYWLPWQRLCGLWALLHREGGNGQHNRSNRVAGACRQVNIFSQLAPFIWRSHTVEAPFSGRLVPLEQRDEARADRELPHVTLPVAVAVMSSFSFWTQRVNGWRDYAMACQKPLFLPSTSSNEPN